jgi:hypothetical protein
MVEEAENSHFVEKDINSVQQIMLDFYNRNKLNNEFTTGEYYNGIDENGEKKYKVGKKIYKFHADSNLIKFKFTDYKNLKKLANEIEKSSSNIPKVVDQMFTDLHRSDFFDIKNNKNYVIQDGSYEHKLYSLYNLLREVFGAKLKMRNDIKIEEFRKILNNKQYWNKIFFNPDEYNKSNDLQLSDLFSNDNDYKVADDIKLIIYISLECSQTFEATLYNNTHLMLDSNDGSFDLGISSFKLSILDVFDDKPYFIKGSNLIPFLNIDGIPISKFTVGYGFSINSVDNINGLHTNCLLNLLYKPNPNNLILQDCIDYLQEVLKNISNINIFRCLSEDKVKAEKGDTKKGLGPGISALEMYRTYRPKDDIYKPFHCSGADKDSRNNPICTYNGLLNYVDEFADKHCYDLRREDIFVEIKKFISKEIYKYMPLCFIFSINMHICNKLFKGVDGVVNGIDYNRYFLIEIVESIPTVKYIDVNPEVIQLQTLGAQLQLPKYQKIIFMVTNENPDEVSCPWLVGKEKEKYELGDPWLPIKDMKYILENKDKYKKILNIENKYLTILVSSNFIKNICNVSLLYYFNIDEYSKINNFFFTQLRYNNYTNLSNVLLTISFNRIIMELLKHYKGIQFSTLLNSIVSSLGNETVLKDKFNSVYTMMSLNLTAENIFDYCKIKYCKTELKEFIDNLNELKNAIIKGDRGLTTQPTENHTQHSQYFFQETLKANDPHNLLTENYKSVSFDSQDYQKTYKVNDESFEFEKASNTTALTIKDGLNIKEMYPSKLKQDISLPEIVKQALTDIYRQKYYDNMRNKFYVFKDLSWEKIDSQDKYAQYLFSFYKLLLFVYGNDRLFKTAITLDEIKALFNEKKYWNHFYLNQELYNNESEKAKIKGDINSLFTAEVSDDLKLLMYIFLMTAQTFYARLQKKILEKTNGLITAVNMEHIKILDLVKDKPYINTVIGLALDKDTGLNTIYSGIAVIINPMDLDQLNILDQKCLVNLHFTPNPEKTIIDNGNDYYYEFIKSISKMNIFRCLSEEKVKAEKGDTGKGLTAGISALEMYRTYRPQNNTYVGMHCSGFDQKAKYEKLCNYDGMLNFADNLSGKRCYSLTRQDMFIEINSFISKNTYKFMPCCFVFSINMHICNKLFKGVNGGENGIDYNRYFLIEIIEFIPTVKYIDGNPEVIQLQTLETLLRLPKYQKIIFMVTNENPDEVSCPWLVGKEKEKKYELGDPWLPIKDMIYILENKDKYQEILKFEGYLPIFVSPNFAKNLLALTLLYNTSVIRDTFAEAILIKKTIDVRFMGLNCFEYLQQLLLASAFNRMLLANANKDNIEYDEVLNNILRLKDDIQYEKVLKNILRLIKQQTEAKDTTFVVSKLLYPKMKTASEIHNTIIDEYKLSPYFDANIIALITRKPIPTRANTNL